ncbi:MAG: 5'-nucleotidase C-terminal domain-containing protein [bacterium]|nr:5'-nucleotidase C-terminal domain-containing protein [bacterium]
MLKKFALAGLLTLALASTVSAQDETFALTLLHTNDTHAAHEPNGAGNGGVARQAAVVNQIRAEGGNVLLLDSGDRFTGSLYHQQYRGADQVQLMNVLGYDAMTLGNHEFDDGEAVLLSFVGGLEFPVVSANIEWGSFAELAAAVAPYTVLDVNGQQVGVIGLTTNDTTVTSSPSPEIGFGDYLPAVESAVAELTEQGVNKIILLTHIGIQFDLELLPQLSGVDVVLGGHSHTLFSSSARASGENSTYPVAVETAAGETVYYAQNGANNQYVGRLDVQFDAEGVITSINGDAIFLSRYITPDPAVEAILTELSGPIEELRATEIGAEAGVFLVGDRTVCRVEECNLGNLITDAMLAETGAQIAIMNAGGIRADIDEGAITLGEVLTVLPFGNLTSTFQLTGADVIAALENGVSRTTVENGEIVRAGANGRFPQVGGIRFSFDPTLEAGSRIVSVEVRGEDGSFSPIDPAATYEVVANDFLRTGGDGYSVFAENAIDPYDFGKPLDQVVAEYMAAQALVEPELEGRITPVNATVQPLS